MWVKPSNPQLHHKIIVEGKNWFVLLQLWNSFVQWPVNTSLAFPPIPPIGTRSWLRIQDFSGIWESIYPWITWLGRDRKNRSERERESKLTGRFSLFQMVHSKRKQLYSLLGLQSSQKNCQSQYKMPLNGHPNHTPLSTVAVIILGRQYYLPLLFTESTDAAPPIYPTQDNYTMAVGNKMGPFVILLIPLIGNLQQQRSKSWANVENRIENTISIKNIRELLKSKWKDGSRNKPSETCPQAATSWT